MSHQPTPPAAEPSNPPAAGVAASFLRKFTVLFGAVRELWIVFALVILTQPGLPAGEFHPVALALLRPWVQRREDGAGGHDLVGGVDALRRAGGFADRCAGLAQDVPARVRALHRLADVPDVHDGQMAGAGRRHGLAGHGRRDGRARDGRRPAALYHDRPALHRLFRLLRHHERRVLHRPLHLRCPARRHGGTWPVHRARAGDGAEHLPHDLSRQPGAVGPELRDHLFLAAGGRRGDRPRRGHHPRAAQISRA